MFILYQKRQFIYPSKLNSLQILDFCSRVFSLVHNFKAQADLKAYFWGKISFYARQYL